MKTIADFALNYLVNSLWQAPLLFAAAWLASRATPHRNSASSTASPIALYPTGPGCR